jgi:hypothetical protein
LDFNAKKKEELEEDEAHVTELMKQQLHQRNRVPTYFKHDSYSNYKKSKNTLQRFVILFSTH